MRSPPSVIYYGRMTNDTFRDRVIDATNAKGWSYKELARKSGVSYDAIMKLKGRDGASTSVENASKLAAALGIDASQHLEGFSEEPSQMQPRKDVLAALGEAPATPASPRNLPDDEIGTIKLAVVNDLIQVAATVDLNGARRLIRRLQRTVAMIEEEAKTDEDEA